MDIDEKEGDQLSPLQTDVVMSTRSASAAFTENEALLFTTSYKDKSNMGRIITETRLRSRLVSPRGTT